MPSLNRIRDRLPSLYQPEDGDPGLVSLWLKAVGTVLDRAQREATEVMQSHWFPYADQAMFNRWFLGTGELRVPPAPFPKPGDPALSQFPYIDDLARIGALVSIAPWEQPPRWRDLVEDYRLRIARIVAVYRNGLGTMGALRRMVEAQLPADQSAPAQQRDRPFWLEEFSPVANAVLPAPTRGAPPMILGPMMRWSIQNDSLAPAAPNFYIQGVAAVPDHIDATVNPMIELYAAGSIRPRVAIGYTDTVAPGTTLRLRAASDSWLGLDTGVVTAHANPPEGGYADPTAPGPWQPSAGGPASPVSALLQTYDLTLWAAAGTSLLRFDGSAWTTVFNGLPHINALLQDSSDLLIATDSGLRRMPLRPPASGPTDPPDPAFDGRKVLSVFPAADSKLWFGTDAGALSRDSGAAVTASPLQGVAVNSVAQDRAGVFFFGTELGAFQWQPGTNSWFWYEGSSFGQENPNWQPFAAPHLPAATQPFLPSVNVVFCDRSGAVWFGTKNGIARYTAEADQSLDFQTMLEAFPDLTNGPVFTIREDERGLLWFGTDRGLFRFDGRDWWQSQAGLWVRLGRADTLYPSGNPRGQWRFARTLAQWQRLDANWISFTAPPRSTAEPAVRSIAWTDSVVADLGTWDGSTFSGATPVPPAKLVVHVKPDEEAILNGGIPALPRLPVGKSVWRYLAIEPPGLVPPAARPWWSREGRLFPLPADLNAPAEGRYDIVQPQPESSFDDAIFGWLPAARVWFEWPGKMPLSVLVRLKKIAPNESVDPSIVDRVWQGIQQVRPAGVRVRLAVEEDIVKS